MSNSIQYALLRVRPPRVQITYDVEIGSAVEKKELPFVVGVMADLAGTNSSALKELKTRPFVEIDKDNFNNIAASINPKITIELPDSKGKLSKHQLSFSSFDDFEPSAIIKQIPDLKVLLDQRIAIKDLLAKMDGNMEFIDQIGLMLKSPESIKALANSDEKASSEILKKSNMSNTDANITAYITNILYSVCKYLAANPTPFAGDEFGFLTLCMSNIDKVLSTQVSCIMHEPTFQQLEANWRGLKYLVFNSETGTSLKIKLLCISKDEIFKDLDKAIEFDQSNLFKKIYEQEYGTLGGNPYSCLVVDLYFGKDQNDIKLLRMLSSLAASAHTPLLTAANYTLFNLKSFGDLQYPRDLTKVFDSSEFAAFNSFRSTEDARYINLMLPRVLMRLPYGINGLKCDDFAFEEEVDGVDNSKFCWGNAAYAMAQRITAAFSEYGWTSAIRGVEGGGKVENLPTYTFKTTNGDVELKCPTEVSITDRREKELSDLGFISICHAKGTDFGVFFGSQSVQKPKQYNTADATANAAISARLPYLLNASRFAHYIKVMIRDKIGSFITAMEVESYLQNWLADYVLLSDDAPQELKAEYPLREGKVTVIEDPANPGAYRAVLFLRPHFQLEELTVSLRLVAKLGS